MRMSDPVDTETMKVCEVADDKMPSIRDNIATKSEVTDQNQSSKDEHGSNNNNKRDTQVKNNNLKMYTPINLKKTGKQWNT